MQEVFEKIISKINEKIEHYDSRHKILTDSGMFGDADRIADRMTELDFTREIVKQAAEEFATDTNVGTNGWIPCSSGNLPEENEDVEVTVEEIANEVGGKRMERLTKRSSNGAGIYNTPSRDPVKWENNRHRVLQKLADYEDLEEQGLLLRLPCKVGDTVYTLRKKIIKEEKVYDVQYRGIKYKQGQRWFMNIGASAYFEMDFGKTVFFTKEEAEAKLEEMEE